MDIASTTEPRSDQQNFDDYIAGPKTVTVEEVKKGSAEQPVEVHLVEFPGRPYKPSKSMRRVLVSAWGAEASVYTGRKMVLYGDPEVRFGGQTVGGIKISQLSHLEKPLSLNLTTTRGKRSPFVVQPLTAPTDTSGRNWLTELAQAAQIDKAAVLSLYRAAQAAHADPGVIELITKAGKELGAAEEAAGQ